MNGAFDISYLSLGYCFLLLLLPFILSLILKLELIKQSLIGVVRMTVQLALIALFLQYIFQLNNPFINVSWFFLMVLTATITSIRKSNLRLRLLFFPAFLSLLIVSTAVLLFFNGVVLGLSDVFSAKYFIAVGGMILGNSLRGIIVAMNSFYSSIKRNEERYLYMLGAGATLMEGILPYYRKSLSSALAPSIAAMATMGIVSLPGMMTGQLLGGSSPAVAVKYQIAIMIAIFTTVAMSVSISILMTVKTAFDEQGILKKTLFR